MNSLENTAPEANTGPGGARPAAPNNQRADKSPGRHKTRHRSRNQEWPTIPDAGKIEEKNPEILAQKILETGRQIEAGRIPALPPGAEARLHDQRHAHPVPEGLVRIHPGDRHPEPRPPLGPAPERVVLVTQRHPAPPIPLSLPLPLPKVEMPLQMGSPALSTASVPARPFSMVRTHEPPRVADFEDRLKLIITNVLNEDKPLTQALLPRPAPAPVPPPPSHSPYASPGSAPPPAKRERKGEVREAREAREARPDYTQVSPAKLALRRHLSQEKLLAMEAVGPGQHGAPRANTLTRNVGDLISGEVERSLELSAGPPAPPGPPASTALDMSMGGKASPRPGPRITRIVEECYGKAPHTPPEAGESRQASPAQRVVYSPISRPSSTEGPPPLPQAPLTMEGLMYPRVKSPRGVPQDEKPRMLPPAPSPGRDGLEARLASMYGLKCTSTPPTPPRSTPPTPPLPLPLQPQHTQDCKPRPNTLLTLEGRAITSDTPVEGLAATLHARFMTRPMLTKVGVYVCVCVCVCVQGS